MSLTSLPHRGGTLRRQESHPPCRLPLGARRPHRDPTRRTSAWLRGRRFTVRWKQKFPAEILANP